MNICNNNLKKEEEMTTLEKPTLMPHVPSFFNDFFDDDTFLNKSWFTKMPAANIVETTNNFTVEMAVPGMNKKDFHVDLENNMLTILCEKEETLTENDAHYTRREFSFNMFNRTFKLPEYVDLKDIEAKYIDGILKVMLPKKEEAKRMTRKEIAIK